MQASRVEALQGKIATCSGNGSQPLTCTLTDPPILNTLFCVREQVNTGSFAKRRESKSRLSIEKGDVVFEAAVVAPTGFGSLFRNPDRPWQPVGQLVEGK